VSVHLFPSRRTCEICGDSEAAGNRWHRPVRNANVLAISQSLYVKIGSDRGRVVPVPRVHVCEKCLVLASQPGKESETLGRLLVGMAVSRYSVITGGSQA
jgi:hypothetical protein